MTRVSTATVGYGDAGVMQSLALMSSLVDAALDSPTVVYFARQLAARAGVRRPYAQAVAIRNLLSTTWRFVDDPPDRDLFIAPAEILTQYQQTGYMIGDCDEAALVGAALGKSIGIPAQFVVYFFDQFDPPAQHVFAVLLTDPLRSVNLDVTRPRGPVPAPTRTLTVDV